MMALPWACALCTHALNGNVPAEPSGWLDWLHCSGCGTHLFDAAGRPACGTGEPVVHGGRCHECCALANEPAMTTCGKGDLR